MKIELEKISFKSVVIGGVEINTLDNPRWELEIMIQIWRPLVCLIGNKNF